MKTKITTFEKGGLEYTRFTFMSGADHHHLPDYLRRIAKYMDGFNWCYFQSIDAYEDQDDNYVLVLTREV